MKILSRRFFGYLKKDAMLLYKRKKYLYLFILLPLIIGALFLLALNPSEYNIRLGVCDFDNSDISKGVFSDLDGFDPIILNSDNCVEEMISKIKLGKLDLGIEIGRGFSDNLEDLKQSKLVVYYDNTDVSFSNLVSWKVDSSLAPFKREVIDSLNRELTSRASSAREGLDIVFEFSDFSRSFNNKLLEVDGDLEKIEELNTEFLTNPIWTDKRPVYEDELGRDAGIVFVFPLLAIFIILMLASTSIIYDKKTNYITRVKSSSSSLSYLLAKILFFTLLVFLQFFIILGLFMFSGGAYTLSFFGILNLLLFVGVLDSLIGFIIGFIANNEGIAVLFSLVISFPLMLISGVFFPIQALPRFVQWSGNLFPLSYQISAAKSVLLFGENFTLSWIWFALGLFVLAFYLVKKR